jgi:hypothetical protein
MNVSVNHILSSGGMAGDVREYSMMMMKKQQKKKKKKKTDGIRLPGSSLRDWERHPSPEAASRAAVCDLLADGLEPPCFVLNRVRLQAVRNSLHWQRLSKPFLAVETFS